VIQDCSKPLATFRQAQADMPAVRRTRKIESYGTVPDTIALHSSSAGLAGLMSRASLIGLIGLIGSGLTGCGNIEPWVKPYERQALADPIMSLNRHPISTTYMHHVYEAREGARGALGGSGGGCGCN